MTAARKSASPAEVLRTMDAKATTGPWVPLIRRMGVTWPGEFSVTDFASLIHGMDGEEGIYCDNDRDVELCATLRNALPALAELLDAADALREFDVAIHDTDSVSESMALCAAYDTARAALVATLKGGTDHA